MIPLTRMLARELLPEEIIPRKEGERERVKRGRVVNREPASLRIFTIERCRVYDDGERSADEWAIRVVENIMNASDFYPRLIPMIERSNGRAAARLMGERDARRSHVTDVVAIRVLPASDYPKSRS